MGASDASVRVLVVDDEALIRWSIAETLAGAGHVVIEASDAATAVRRLAEEPEPIDVVLLDYRLPDSNGLALVTLIRQRSPESIIVLMTAYGTPEVIAASQELGVHRVLSKPFDMDELASVVQDAHRTRRGIG